MKKSITTIVAAFLLTATLAGCSAKPSEDTGDTGDTGGTAGKDITVVSREDGSGTRGAFIELMGVQEKDADGNKTDKTTEEAIIVNSTSVVMTTVEGNTQAIGYISLGAVNDTIKALKVDGVEATAENIKNGTYTVARPFNIATKAGVSAVAQDFISYILSPEGQKVVEDKGYIAIENAQQFTSAAVAGKIVVAGSSSVTPVMEKLKEAYLAVNPNAEIDIQESDSSTGMNAAIEGTCDIGMASREVKQSELDKGLTSTVIATDGIAIIVNKSNATEEMTKDEIKAIFTGEVTKWEK